MATTHNPNQAFLYAKFMIKNLRLDDVIYEILDSAAAQIWYAAPWSWTVRELTTLTLANATVDYTITTTGASIVDSLYKAFLVSSADGGDAIVKPLKIEPILPATPVKVGETLSVAIAAADTIRVYPKPTATLGKAQKILLYGKKPYTPITSSNYTTTGSHNLDDKWWHVYKSAVLVEAYKYADDDRGFTVQYDTQSRSAKMGAELALFNTYLDEMRKKEPMPFEWETYAEAVADRR